MAHKVTPELARSLAAQGLKTVALAPEAGSEALRRRMGKRISDARFLEAVANLASAGIRKFKLYFMLGLPTETSAHLDEILELTLALQAKAREAGQKGEFTLSINAFVPKAWTPFQWEPMAPLKELEEKFSRLEDRIRPLSGITFDHESPRLSYLQALLSRGDRRVGDLLYQAAEEHRDWRWLVNVSRKEKAGESNRPSLDWYVTRRFSFEEMLPWDHLDSGISKELLQREADKAYSGDDRLCGEVSFQDC
jgi:radical SAM superfamily enzyme YgiQ (UPF0313 family)